MGSPIELLRGVTPRIGSGALKKLPAELLILNRIGIGYPYLLSAWQIAQRLGRNPEDILIESGIITHALWDEAQKLLAEKRRDAYFTQRQKRHLLFQSINNLSRQLPQYSAVKTLSKGQKIRLCTYAGIFALIGYFWLYEMLELMFMAITVFYSGVIIMRGMMLADFQDRKQRTTLPLSLDDTQLPIYTALIALYQEKTQVAGLVAQLMQIDWPKDKLDIKLICETDDKETIAEILEQKLPSYFHLVVVPPAEPKTKPKALNYALPLARGEFIVLYDAEDRPVPGQLREAYTKFLRSSEKLVCIQAPLQIHNKHQNWLTAMFAIEYMTLFNGMLPVLAKWKVPIPLGGTSNHFRAKVLKEIGGWDPYNVTEDADLGIRIFREGYHTATINSPTYEEAPPVFIVWLKQRTRWIKGWMQTLLVHSRNPVVFMQEMGFRNTVAYHLVMTSLLMSVMLHPLLLIMFGVNFTGLPDKVTNPVDGIIAAASGFNLVGGYTTYGLLALIVLQSAREYRLISLIFSLPIYWMLISYASWRALFYLIIAPHKWEKTEHGLAKKDFHITNS